MTMKTRKIVAKDCDSACQEAASVVAEAGGL